MHRIRQYHGVEAKLCQLALSEFVESIVLKWSKWFLWETELLASRMESGDGQPRLLGVMTRLHLKIRDEKSLHIVASIRPEAEIFAVNDPIDLVKDSDYGQFWWNPIAKSFLHVLFARAFWK